MLAVGGVASARLTPSLLHRSFAVDESCQSILSHSDISYDHTEDDVVRNDLFLVPGFSFSLVVKGWFCPVTAVGWPLCMDAVGVGSPQVLPEHGCWGCLWPNAALPAPSFTAVFQDVDMTVVRPLKRKTQERKV